MAYNKPISNDIEFDFTDSAYTPPTSNALEMNFTANPDNVYRILGGSSTLFTAIWAEPDANIQSSKFYIASAGTGAAFSVINLSTKALVGVYTETTQGVGGETLEGTDIVDINVNG